ncbi:MAG: beta-ketoacyl-[acyl-carrier-protein] synthase family protein [gamma proteobacterium symbiont of Bathyaustriella thionipta]|nr:beta-ketoacyl-[acyl-carrier-protein] synthase family protein [gamma proteobacterium symbiont of Bathyaustriella thionipta]
MIAITGTGCISALSLNASGFTSKLSRGIGAISKQGESGTYPGAYITDFDPASHFTQEQLALLDPFSTYAVVAGREAIADAGLTSGHLQNAAAVIGTGCAGKHTDEETYQKLYVQKRKRVHPLTIPKGMPSAASCQTSILLDIQGPTFSVTSACSSAAHAIAQAALMIRAGIADVAIAGGTDAPFTYGLTKAWEALRILSKDTCRPFSENRSGLVLGEGAGIIVLESERHAKARNANIKGYLAGIGMSSDASHITLPSAQGAAKAMLAALKDAQLDSKDIDYINAHGTGTIVNDATETKAIHIAFGNHAEQLAVSSTKSMHGHTLGAAGAMEAIATIEAIRTSIIPPTINFTQAGENCDLDYVPNKPKKSIIRYAISNSFAFGGQNAVLLFASNNT